MTQPTNSSQRRLKTILLFPPDWNKEEPYYSLPCLTSVLRADGVEVIQKDVNIEFYDHMLTRTQLLALWEQQQAAFELLEDRDELDYDEQCAYEGLARDSHFLPQLADRIEEAVEFMRTPNSMLDRRRYRVASRTINHAVVTVQRHLGRPGVDIERSADILAATAEPYDGPYERFLREHTIPFLKREDPDVIGLSITATQQLLPGFTLARLIRDAGLRAHVAVGGDIISIARDSFQQVPEWYDLADTYFYFEGETPFLKLHQALRSGTPLDDVPNCSFRRDGRIIVNSCFSSEDLDALPTPDFHGLPWERYFTSERFLCVTGARGCHWGRCTFCTLSYGINGVGAVRFRDPAKVAADIEKLKAEHGGDHFYVAGNGVPPTYLAKLADEIIESDADIVWGCEAKIEKTLTTEVLEKLARSGLRRIQYGVESATHRVLNRLMKKGCKISLIEPAIENTARLGIANHVFIMLGFPGETEEEALETWNLVRRVSKWTFTLAVSPFNFNRYAPIDKSTEKYQVQVHRHPEADLARSYAFSVEAPAINSGQAMRMAREVRKEFNEWTAWPESSIFGFHKGLMLSAALYRQDPNYLQRQADPEKRAHSRAEALAPPPSLATSANGRRRFLKVASGIHMNKLRFDLRQVHQVSRDDIPVIYDELTKGKSYHEVLATISEHPRLPSSPTDVVFDSRGELLVYRLSPPAAGIVRLISQSAMDPDDVIASVNAPRVERHLDQLLSHGILEWVTEPAPMPPSP